MIKRTAFTITRKRSVKEVSRSFFAAPPSCSLLVCSPDHQELATHETGSMQLTKAFQGVALVWESQNHRNVRISLEPMSLVQTDDPKMPSLRSPAIVSNEEEAIPKSVLQFERQLRKVQHFKRTGAVLQEEDLQVLFTDDAIVVVNKPSGILSVPGVNANPSIVDLVFEKYGQEVDGVANMIVHRLDMDTSGILVFSRHADITRRLHAIFRDRDVKKEYLALVQGHFPDWIESGLVDLPIQRDHEHPPFMRVATPASEAAAADALVELQTRGWKKLVKRKPKISQTEFAVVERGEKHGLPFTRIKLTPITGRTHQLRVHLAALGFPIVGDPVYSLFGEANAKGGLQRVEAVVRDTECREVSSCPLTLQKGWISAHPPNEQPMLLHAARLEFEHPLTGEPLCFQADPAF